MSSEVSAVLPDVLAYCLQRLPNDEEKAMSDAMTLLRTYSGEASALLDVLRAKYGPVPNPLMERARTLACPITPFPTKPLPTETPSPRSASASSLSVRDAVSARMRRRRVAEDGAWRQVYETSAALLATLKAAQHQAALQDVEAARLETAIAERHAAERAAQEACGERERARATEMTERQLQCLRQRAQTGGAWETVSLEAQRQQRRRLREQRAEEEALVRIYGRVLLQHIAAFPLSPLREELRHADAELWRLTLR